MALNEKIIQEVKDQTEKDPVTRKFLIALLQFELEPHGWFTKEYRQRIEKAVKEADKDAL